MTDFDRSRFRAELILALPDGGWHEGPKATFPGGYHQEDDTTSYDRDALAAWILEQVDAAAETPDSALSRIVEHASAASTIKAMVEFSTYLTALADVLRRGHTLASQHDLARTITAEAAKLQGVAGSLLIAYPNLVDVEKPEPKLVLPGENG